MDEDENLPRCEITVTEERALGVRRTGGGIGGSGERRDYENMLQTTTVNKDKQSSEHTTLTSYTATMLRLRRRRRSNRARVYRRQRGYPTPCARPVRLREQCGELALGFARMTEYAAIRISQQDRQEGA